MAKKQTSKRKFDWMTYSRPARALTSAQEQALSAGVLRPLLELALARDELALEIRARSAQLYYRGASLLRLSGDGPFLAEIDVSHRLERDQRSGESLERRTLLESSDVQSCVAAVADLCGIIDSAWDPSLDTTERAARQMFAEANSGRDLFADEYVVVDLDYTYGQRRYDLIALQRTEGVTGPGGFANCELTFIELRRTTKGMSGTNGFAPTAGDLADLSKAIGGTHLARVREEVEELTRQKVRLGLLPGELELRALEQRMPQLLAVISTDDVASDSVDRAAIELHEKLAAKHFPTEHLRFAGVPPVEGAVGDDLALREGDAMTYREFKSYRKARAEE